MRGTLACSECGSTLTLHRRRRHARRGVFDSRLGVIRHKRCANPACGQEVTTVELLVSDLPALVLAAARLDSLN